MPPMLAERLRQAERTVAQREGARATLLKTQEDLAAEIAGLDADLKALEKAVWLLQQYAETQQKALTEQVEGIVTKGLRAVFQNQSLEFKLRYSEGKDGAKKKNPEVSMAVVYEHNGEKVEGDLRTSFGGGLSVVTAILLKVVIVLYLNPRVAPVLLLDEPLKDLSPAYDGGDAVANGYRIRMAEFLRELVNQTPLQIIAVTHEPEYGEVADIHHRFSGGVGLTSKIKTIKHEEELNEY